MALLMSNFSIRLYKDSNDDLRITACYVKKSSESADLTTYVEKEVTVDSETSDALVAAIDALSDAVKASDNLQ